jgi:dipeptidyl aminopeptidase/acylaminoacyl peptidase
MAAAKKKSAPVRERFTEDSGPKMRRWDEQRWLIDNTIRTVGVEWDQPRLGNYATACGPLAAGDIAAIRQRVQKYADINPVFEAVARRREAVAREADAAGHAITARDNYFIAAVFWAASQWTLLANDAHNHGNNTRKRECFLGYAKNADHRVEAAWIKMPGGKKMPGWFHLPYGYKSGRVPAVVSIPGMDGFKESNIALAGDRWLSRGIAVLVIDGPGQYESALCDIPFSVPAWKAAGKAAYEWLQKRVEIDAARIGIIGNSFGSFFATIAAAWEPRYRAVAVSSICFEPGGETIFEQASPTFKRRFMYMSAITDEARFDRFRKSITLKGHASRIRAPYLCVAGERDELCPIVWAERTLADMAGPKQLVVYQESRHTVGNVPSTVLGPNPPSLSADWMRDRLAGVPFDSTSWFVEASGNVRKSAF